MKQYTEQEPVFSASIPIVEEADLVDADNTNASAKQLLQNTLVLSQRMPVFELEGNTLVISGGLWNGSGGGTGEGGMPCILPAATAERLGGVKIGDGIGVTTDGTISTDVTAIAQAAAATVEENAEEYTEEEIRSLFTE